MITKNKTLIIWDWNGTIVDDTFIFVKILNSFLHDYRLPQVSVSEYKNHFSFPVKKYYSLLGFNLSKNSFEFLSSSFINKYKKQMFLPALVVGIFPLLKLLFFKNSVDQFVVSAQEHSLLRASIKHYKTEAFFNGVFGLNNNLANSKISLIKKHIYPIKHNYSKILFIGDTLHDLEVSKSISESSCCLVSWGHNSLERLVKSQPTAVVSSSIDLKRFINNFLYS